MLRRRVLLAMIPCVALLTMHANGADESKTKFPPALKLRGPIDPTVKPPTFGYVSGSAGGAFTLDRAQGHASFRWNHELDVDWHDHDTVYVGAAQDTAGNYYWVYTLNYPHDGHVDKVWLYFAETAVPDDLGFRVFFGHAFYEAGDPEPSAPAEHDIHLWCVDAVRFGPHEDHPAGAPEAKTKSRFNILMTK